MTAPTQLERVLRALRVHGAFGVTQVDFNPPVCDGGPPILRVAARVDDLRSRGHVITTAGRRHKCAVYVLVGDTAAPRDPAAAAEQDALFAGTVGLSRPRCALRDHGVVS